MHPQKTEKMLTISKKECACGKLVGDRDYGSTTGPACGFIQGSSAFIHMNFYLGKKKKEVLLLKIKINK